MNWVLESFAWKVSDGGKFRLGDGAAVTRDTARVESKIEENIWLGRKERRGKVR